MSLADLRRTALPFSIALLALSICESATPLAAQNGQRVHPTTPPEVRAAPAAEAITLDGRLDEAAWSRAPAATDFRQSQPNEGEPATQRTEVRFLYDADALYVGARMFDELGAAGVRTRLVRRDVQPESDLLTIVFDSYHDHLGRTEFSINPSGVKGDAIGPGGTNVDASWDPVWQAATAIDSLGWTAELRIPFAQLRFPRDSSQTWGLQVVRLVNRLNERSHWSWWPLDEVGGPSRYGHLSALRIEADPGQAEILPYVVAQTEQAAPGNPDDPFYEESEGTVRAGVDLKYLVTSNLTLAATINPDFGQVEVDPAVVNLSAFETFFPERRPFFVEGQGVFAYGSLWCFFCSNVSSLGLFYSRRIGRPPQGASIARGSGQFADVPDNTTILGAAKLTGRTRDGWTIGVLDAVTRRESATVATIEGEPFDMPVEPRTNYFVGRLKKDLRDGNIVLGGIATSVVRDLESPALEGLLSSHAEAVGFDSEWWWDDKTYHLLAQGAVSQVSGSPEAMRRVQTSSARYFQRPDREHGDNDLFSDRFDPDATALRGYGAYARLSKESGAWLAETSLNVRSPGFEVNDAAFLTRADLIWMNANVLRQYTEPTSWYRSLSWIVGGQQQFNYDGDLTDREYHGFLAAEFPNYWNSHLFYIRKTETFDDRLLRGGPVVKSPGYHFVNGMLATDSRRQVVLGTGGSIAASDDGSTDFSTFLDATIKPASNVSITLGPSYSVSESGYQFVTALDDPTADAFYGRRYVFADLRQETLAMSTRMSWTFSPTLSFELFAQPFLSSADYDRFKEFVRPRTLQTGVYGEDVGTIAASGTGHDREYLVDPDAGGPAESFTFNDPDFSFRSLRGNAVLRWEYRPGSTIFLVWTQDRSNVGPSGDFDFDRDRRALFDADPNDIFLIKANYWLGF
ncbi:MAG: DUF5916 domain-containing protein [Longimicrobiales bacterium]